MKSKIFFFGGGGWGGSQVVLIVSHAVVNQNVTSPCNLTTLSYCIYTVILDIVFDNEPNSQKYHSRKYTTAGGENKESSYLRGESLNDRNK